MFVQNHRRRHTDFTKRAQNNLELIALTLMWGLVILLMFWAFSVSYDANLMVMSSIVNREPGFVLEP